MPLLAQLEFDEAQLVRHCVTNPSGFFRQQVPTLQKLYHRRTVEVPSVGTKFATRNFHRNALDLQCLVVGQGDDAILAVEKYSHRFQTYIKAELSGERTEVFAQTYRRGEYGEVIVPAADSRRARMLQSIAETLWVTNMSLLCDPAERAPRDRQAHYLLLRSLHAC